MLWNVLLTNAALLLQRVRLQNSCWKLGQWPVFNKIFPPNYRVNFKNVAWSHPRFICAVSYRQYINYSPYTFWAQFWFSNWICKAFMKISTLAEIIFFNRRYSLLSFRLPQGILILSIRRLCQSPIQYAVCYFVELADKLYNPLHSVMLFVFSEKLSFS